MPRGLFVSLAWVGVVIGSGCSEPAPPMSLSNDLPTADALATDPKLQFVGNWELVGRERISADGELLPLPDAPSPGAEGEVPWQPIRNYSSSATGS